MGAYFEAPRSRNFTLPPSFMHLALPEGYFQGGGVGVYKILAPHSPSWSIIFPGHEQNHSGGD